MPQKRKSKLKDFVPRRSMRIQNRQLPGVMKCVDFKCSTRSTSILDLPNELILMIFNLLSHDDLLNNVTFVCKRWQDLTAAFWTKIKLKKGMPAEMIQRWIPRAPLLKHLAINGRQDLNNILEMVFRNCKELETLQLSHCSGSCKTPRVRGGLMCDLLRHCKSLTFIHLKRTTFKSSKFFSLLPHATKANVSYVGGVTCRDLTTLLKSVKPEGKKPKVLSIKMISKQRHLNLTLGRISKLLGILKLGDKDCILTIMWHAAQNMYNPYFIKQTLKCIKKKTK